MRCRNHTSQHRSEHVRKLAREPETNGGGDLEQARDTSCQYKSEESPGT